MSYLAQLDSDRAWAIYSKYATAARDVSTEDEARAIAAEMEDAAREVLARDWEPYPWQHPHIHPEGWVSQRAPGLDVCDERCADLPVAPIPTHGAWLQRGGRGTGKTEGAGRYVNDHAMSPHRCDPRVPGGHRMTIVGPTQADAVSSCVEGVSGLRSINPLISITTNREGTIVRWPNGSVAKVLGANSEKDVNRARAWTNVCLWWLEEAAAQPQLEGILEQAPFTLRLGSNPHTVITTTPLNRPVVQQMLASPSSIQTWGRTQDAYRLDPIVRDALYERYAGTTLGRQELGGEEIGDVDGALWVSNRPALVNGVPNPDERPGIENDRIPISQAPVYASHAPNTPTPVGDRLHRVIVAVDPPGGRTEAGIVVVGTIGQHGYVLADLSLAGPPDTWANVAIRAYIDYGAEGIAAEHAYGGDMVDDVLRTRTEALGLDSVPIFRVPTKVGKRLRAEPVQALYQQHRVHHIGLHPLLESEMTSWIPGETEESPNRLDALVHGLTYLLIRASAGKVANPARQPRRIQRAGGYDTPTR